MKQLFIFSILLLPGSASVYAQSFDSLQSNAERKTHYLRLSREQKTSGTIALVTGGVAAVIGGYLWFMAPIAGISESGNVEGAKRTGQTLVIVGSSLAAVSIPLFVASNKNKKRAMLYVGSVHLPYLPLKGSKEQLAIGLRVNL